MNDLARLRTQAVLAVEAIMTPEERQAFLARLVDANPRLQGAQVADLLDILENGDARLDVLEDERYEAVYDACEAAWGDLERRPGIGSLVASYALYALLYARGEEPSVDAAIVLGTAAVRHLAKPD